jgi:NarL family two-component system sensor histidine kinase YdfH
MMKRMLTKEPLRWFLLLWIAMVVAGALLVRTIISSDMYVVMVLSRSADDPIAPSPMRYLPDNTTLQWPHILNHTLPLSTTLIFLLLAALYSFLLWNGLSQRVQPRFFWLYFLLQGLLVAVMQWMLQAHYLALNFYLVLTLCAVVMFKRAAPALLVGMSCLLLFFVLLDTNFLQDIPPEMHLVALRFNIWSFSDLTTMVFFVLGYLILYTQQSQSQIQLEQTHLELQGAYSRLAASSRQIETLTRLAERQRLARELHDTLAQGIAGMIMQLEVTSAQMHRKNYQQAQEVLSQALVDARTTLHDARHAIIDLRSRTPHVDQLISSVQQEITHFFQKTGIVHHTNLNDLIHTPAHACEHALRFIGEGLNNVARHAHAHQVRVEAKREETWLVITVQDDGQGFDPTNLALSTGHYGLLGLQERANLVEGTLSVNSSDGKGTTLEFRIPLATSDDMVLAHKQAKHFSANVEEQSYV